MALSLYTPQRLVHMTILAAVMVPLAYLLGFTDAATGIVVGTPIAVLNYRSSCLALQAANNQSGSRATMALWMRSILRIIVDMISLAAAAFLGAEFLLGVLAGILLELFSYYIDVVRLLLAWHRGETVWEKKSKN